MDIITVGEAAKAVREKDMKVLQELQQKAPALTLLLLVEPLRALEDLSSDMSILQAETIINKRLVIEEEPEKQIAATKNKDQAAQVEGVKAKAKRQRDALFVNPK